MSWINKDTIASTSKTWMNPPSVYEDAKPSAHKTSRMTKIVHSTGRPPSSALTGCLAGTHAPHSAG
jgi:hypothetical protein